jgi:AAA family ATP:ADP antiporter
VNAITILAQLFVTGRLAVWLGLPRLLAALPALSLIGFGALAALPSAPVLIGYQVLRRAATYGVTGPALQVLFTVLSREEKYKAKNVIDTVVYRGADAVSGWAYAGLTALGMGISAIALLALPVSAVWTALAVHLGRREEEMRHGG